MLKLHFHPRPLGDKLACHATSLESVHFFVKSDVFRQCQWDTSCRTRRELSNAIVKSDFRLTGVELWPFPFRNATPSVTSLIVL